MRIARLRIDGSDWPEARIVAAADDLDSPWVDVRIAEQRRLLGRGATLSGARRLSAALVPGGLTAALENGEAFTDAVRAAVASAPGEALLTTDTTTLLAPVDPPAYRDFMAFERHFRFSYDRAGAPVPDVLYELPVSYMGSAQAIIGPEDEVRWPAYSEHIDYELELGIVIGKSGRDIVPERALEHVLGFTLLNDFSARDMQFREMAGRLGPSKGKHFATAVGPAIITVDAVDPAGLELSARINGEEWSRATSDSILWSVAELVAWASAGEPLVAGTLLGSGTVGGGTGFELNRQLASGDVVELEMAGLGVLRNRIVTASGGGWLPERKWPSLAVAGGDHD